MESPAMQAISAFQLQLAEMEIVKHVISHEEEPSDEEVEAALHELDQTISDEESPEYEKGLMKSEIGK